MKTTFTTRTANPAPERGSPFQGHMRLADLVYGVWALMPEQLLELQAIYETHLRGEKIDIKAIEASLGRPLANQQRTYEVVNGVALIGLQGAISPKANLFSQISGGASAQLFVRDVNAAAADSSVQSAIIVADTPGGNVLGIPAAREAVRAFGERKPIVTHSDGVLASAGYWIGRAANQVLIADSMVQVGSIGVVYTHTDTSAAEAKAGVKKTVITSGKFKCAEGPDGKLSEEGLANIQERADYVYSVFVGNVAEDAGVDVDTVLEHMADGRVFIGQQGLDAGLVDGVSTLDSLIESMATNPAAFSSRSKAKVKAKGKPKSTSAGAAAEDETAPALASADPANPTEGQTMADPTNPQPMTREVLARDHQALHAEILALGASAERDRVAAVRAMLVPGHEALIERLSADGKTTGPEAAAAIVVATQVQLKAAADAHAKDAPNAAPGGGAGDAGGDTKTKQQQVDEAKKYQAEHKVTFIDALKALGYAS